MFARLHVCVSRLAPFEPARSRAPPVPRPACNPTGRARGCNARVRSRFLPVCMSCVRVAWALINTRINTLNHFLAPCPGRPMRPARRLRLSQLELHIIWVLTALGRGLSLRMMQLHRRARRAHTPGTWPKAA